MKNKQTTNDPLVVGEELHTIHGEVVVVLSTFYKNSRQFVWVEFQDETKYVTSVLANNILKGVLYNPYRKSVCDIGYFGEGIHRSKGERYTRVYQTWRLMLHRAYDSKRKTKVKYKVCTAWHNYQTFAEWYIVNRSRKGERSCFVFDVIGEDTYLYSPTTCYLSPVPVKHS